MRQARLDDHPPAAILRQLVQQQAGKGEMAEVIDRELQFAPGGGGGQRRHHHARIVDQEIDPLLVRGFFRRLPDRRDIGEVEMEEGEIGAFRSAPDIFDGFVRLVGIAAGEEHARAFSGQPACDLEADPRIRSGDDGRPAGLFGDIGIGETHANISNCATGAKLRR